MKVITYSSNNSGGDWWLSDEDWLALEAAGWKVRWVSGDSYFEKYHPGTDRWIGALATEASRTGLSLDDAIAEWEEIVGQDCYESGCDCCGPPHYFSEDEVDTE